MKAGLRIPQVSCPVVFKFCRNPNNVSLRLETPAITSISRTMLPSARAVPLNRADVISELFPFIQRLHGKTIVVKYEGSAMESPQLRQSVVKDLVLLSCVGLKIVLVHGGRTEINSWLTKIGVEPEFSDGLMEINLWRTTLKVAEMVYIEHVSQVVPVVDIAGATALGFCASDTNFLRACHAPRGAALAFLGGLSSVSPDILHPILANSNIIPIIAPIAADQFGQRYNISKDTAAAEIAAAIGAEKLILLTDVAGVLEDANDPNSLIKEIDISGIKKMIAEGKLTGGMIPMVESCIKSLTEGVHTTSIVDGRIPHSLLLEILTDENVGTMIRN